MKKFKCKESECGNIFDGDITTTECPYCGSNNIIEVKKFPKWILDALEIVACFVLVILLWPKDYLELELSYDNVNNVTITADGYSYKKLSSDYVIEVIDGSSLTQVTIIQFRKDKTAYLSANNMLAGTCYNFNLKHKKGKAINSKEYRWKGNNRFCMPEESPCIAFGLVTISTVHVANRVNGTYSVTITLQNVDDKIDKDRIEYIIDGQKQNSNVFEGIKPGTYQIDVNYVGCIMSTTLILNEIEPLKILTLQEARDIFNKVRLGSMSVGVAYELLAEGSVDLKNSIDEYNKLFDILMDISAFGLEYKIVSFDVDKNTGKIKSGTLVITK